MTKDESTIIKGIAILMMLFLHLFNGLIHNFHSDLLNEPYQPLFYIGNYPIEYIITRCCRPVPFFFILSGYGISYIYTNGKLSMNGQAKRLLHIFTAYWISLLIFVSIGHFIGNENYPGDIWKLIGNITSYSDSYNLSMWFLFPYTMICLSSILLIRIIEYKKSYLTALIVTGLIYGVTGYIIKNHINEIGYDSIYGHLLQYLQYFFPFTCGIIIQRTSILKHPKWKILEQNKLLTAFLLFLVIALKCLMDSQALDTLYAIAFICLFIKLSIKQSKLKIISIIGKYSMGMWMVHMYLSHYFFTDFIYSFRYSPIIFLILVICSFTISLMITYINDKLSLVIIPSKNIQKK